MRPLHYKFGVVLVLILTTLTFTLAAPIGDGGRFVAVSLQAATLVAAVVASRAHRWVIRLTVVVAILGIAGSAATLVGTDEFGQGSAVIVALPYVILTPFAIVTGLRRHILEDEGINMQTMFGVLCLYLLLGLLFSVTYAVVQEISNEPFFTTKETAHSDDFLYYSFSTLTTVGFGDLVAAKDVGRSLSIAEALVGQIYLVTVVAVIVSNLSPMRPSERA